MTAWLLLAFLVARRRCFCCFAATSPFLSDMGTFEIVIVAAGVLLVAVYILILLAAASARARCRRSAIC